MTNGVRLAKSGDIPSLCEIWELCFHDPGDYIRCFYRENFSRISVLVYTVNDKPVSMFHILDSSFINGEKRQDAKFLYAGGTHPEYRGRGYYSALFAHVKGLADRNGSALFLKPALRELIPYYRALGFEPDSCFRFVTVRPGEKLPLSVSPLSPEEYNRMRNRAFCGRPYAKWPDRHVCWCAADNEYFGGKTLAFEFNGKEHFLMACPSGDTLEITETDLSLDELKQASGALCALFGTELLKAYMPDYSCEEGEEIVSSVIYNAPMNNTYVNLLLS